ncbi:MULTISPECIES: PepSY domain-containing protein [Alphaproteobacteria]|uniref:PepSY-associated TM helix domain-containing protein n=1 Tax=Alphaproteobacteria TaxID=28211 RepID=UPI0012BC7C6A|nr:MULTISPECIES: PepSY domain-containing protein [Alphaproteobacteria]MTI03194.1 PepSY domain-containing protein [Roseibium sp. RKSG952]
MAMDSQNRAADAAPRDAAQKFYFAAWRWHFYAGIFVIPFLIILAVTGLMMMFITQFDGRDGEKIAVEIQGDPLPVSRQAELALAEVPGQVVEWIGPKATDLATVFRIKTDAGQLMVALDPYSGDVIETWDRRAGWYDFADNIHSTLMIGDTGDRILEIAAGLSLVLVFTGLYLWWPRGNSMSVFVPNLRARGRALWKSLHAVVGFWMSGLLVVFLISGLSWAGVWGGMIVQPWSSFPAEKWDNVPLSDDIHASMNHGHQNDVPWALEQTPMPASGSDAGIDGIAQGVPIDIDALVQLGTSLGMQGRFRVAYPGGENGVWTLNRDSMSSDSTDPINDRTVHVDQYTGKILADVRYQDYSVMGKSMAIGIPLHMGLIGVWNFVLNLVFCLSVIFVCISGVVMWIKRRPKGEARLAPPPLPAEMPIWKGAVLIGLFTAMAFPLVGLTLLGVLALDLLIISNIPAMKRALS